MEDLKPGVTSDDRISTWGVLRQQRRGRQLLRQRHPVADYQLRNGERPHPCCKLSYDINEYQKIYLIDRAIHEAGFDFNNKSVAFWAWPSRSTPTTCAIHRH